MRVSEGALRKLVTAAHHRDVLLDALRSSPSAVGGEVAGSSQRGSGPVAGRHAAGRGARGLEPHVTWPELDDKAVRGASGGDPKAVPSPSTPDHSGAETLLVRQMRQKLEEALDVAEGLRRDKAALHKELQAMHMRSTASRKIADKARSGEKDLSESLSTLTREHRDLVERMIHERQEHATKTRQLQLQAAGTAQAMAHMTRVLTGKLPNERLRRSALRCWKACALDSLMELLSKSSLILKCAAVAHTRSSLRSTMCTATRAWSMRASVASAAVLRAQRRTSGRARLKCGQILVVWRTWARAARFKHVSARITALVCMQHRRSRSLTRAFFRWHLSMHFAKVAGLTGTPSRRMGGEAAVDSDGDDADVNAYPVVTFVLVRKQRGAVKRAVSRWKTLGLENKRLRCVRERVLRLWKGESLARSWRHWRQSAATEARLHRLSAKATALVSVKLVRRTLHAWGVIVAADVRARRVIAKCLARWTRQAVNATFFLWAHVASDRRRKTATMRKILLGMRCRGLRQAFSSWASAWEVVCIGDSARRQAEAAEMEKRETDLEAVWRQKVLEGSSRLSEKDQEIAKLRSQLALQSQPVALCDGARPFSAERDDDDGSRSTAIAGALDAASSALVRTGSSCCAQQDVN